MEIFEKLGLGLFEILFHAVNILILIVVLYFLLYKPVKKLINNHKAKLDEVFQENQKLSADAGKLKAEYEKKLSDAKEESVRLTKEAAEKAQKLSDETLEQAKLQATAIVKNAEKEAAAERRMMERDFKKSVGKLAVEVAEKVLEREVNEKDNQKLIDESLKEWNK